MNMDCMYTSLSDSISIMYSVGVYIYVLKHMFIFYVVIHTDPKVCTNPNISWTALLNMF